MALRNTIYFKFYIVLCFVFAGATLKAQDTISAAKDTAMHCSKSCCTDSLKHNFYINMFSVLPMNGFKSTDYNNANAGYAKIGYGADVGYICRFWESLGVGINLSYTKNNIDNNKLAEQIKDITTTQTQGGFATIYSSAASAYWQTYSIAGGLSYQFWFGTKKNIGVEPSIYVGESYVNTPHVVYNVRIDNTTLETRASRKGSWNFMQRDGIAINYLIKNRTIVHFNYSYFSATGNGTEMEHIVIGNSTYTRTLTDYKININAIYLGFGITTRF